MALLRALATLLALTPGLALAASASDPAVETREVENLAAFARCYGYVRFFHPGERGPEVNWDKVAFLGADAARTAADPAALASAILSVLQPIAPGVQLGRDADAPPPSPARSERLVFWQYEGVKLGEERGPYRHRRVRTDATSGEWAPLFTPATPPEPRMIRLQDGLVLHLPMALPADENGRTNEPRATEYAELRRRLDALDLSQPKADDWRLRVAGVITVWNIFQHFHPYLDQAGVDWMATLRPALQRALRDETPDDYYRTLSELVAQTHDGHGYIYGPAPTLGGLPLRVAVIEDRVTVTGTRGNTPFRKGDVIERIDGLDALESLRERERFTAGSPHLRQFRALNQYGQGPLGSLARVEIVRDGQTQVIEHRRASERRGFFFNSVGEFEFPDFAEVKPGIFYLNLYRFDASRLELRLGQLAEARGVIFDWRSDGRPPVDAKFRSPSPHQDIIPHLIDQAVKASPMLVPRVTQPDRQGWTYRESSWPVQPKAPRLKGKVVFINEPTVVSFGETCMAMIADYHLATLVGAPTAGTNGNVNFIPLPGGLRVMWTGMDVRKHDGSPFYGVGFVPDVPVARTRRAVLEGRDEYLEAAIATIEQSSPRN